MSGFTPGDVVIYVGNELNNCSNRANHYRALELFGSHSLVKGRAYTVASLVQATRCDAGFHLREVSWPNPAGFCAGSFRKIDPAYDEFTEQMRALRPVRAPLQAGCR